MVGWVEVGLWLIFSAILDFEILGTAVAATTGERRAIVNPFEGVR
jgi:hypothetical protein